MFTTMFTTKINRLSFAVIGFAILPLVSACQTANTVNDTQQIEQKQIMPKPIQKANKPTANKNVLQDVLLSYDWQLKSATDKNQQAIKTLTNLKDPIKLKFQQDKQGVGIGLDLGCNQMLAPIKLQGAKLVANPFMMTQMSCGNDLDKAERTLTKFMQGTSQIAIMPMNYLPNPSMAKQEKAMLQQVTADGSTLTWEGKLTDTAKYGKGQTMFLEVAPETQHCSSGIKQTCLKVRDVFYDKNGIKTGTGKWRLMKNPIKGYQHNPKTRQVLRVKKYVTDPVDVKGKQIIYVFDMAVETEFVQ